MRHVADHAPGRAEIEQQRAGRGQQDVVRRDVAVVTLRGVHHAQGVEQRTQPGAQRGFVGHLAHRRQGALQSRALVERHHHVGGAVLLPEPVHLDQRRVVEAREQPGLVDEALQAGLEGLLVPVGLDDDGGGRVHARRHRGRHVLLDRNAALQRMVVCEVDDAEAALADQSGDLVVADARPVRQGVPELHARFPMAALARRWADDGPLVVVLRCLAHRVGLAIAGSNRCRRAGDHRPRQASIVACAGSRPAGWRRKPLR